MDNTCVCCGVIIPEGRMVCPQCESAFVDNVELRIDYNLPIKNKELQEYEKIIKEREKNECKFY
jgi:hypothetical protein